jgi:hypothetical protein
MSLNDWTKLVSMSVRKKCLNYTRPNGAIIMLRKVFHIRMISVLKRQLKGLRHMPIIETRANKVKPATAFLNINSILMMKTCNNRQIRNIAIRIVVIYKE